MERGAEKVKKNKNQMAGQLDLMDEIIADNFAGGGGASIGIELALGRPVDYAINHDPAAILMHKTNHPYTKHLQASVWDIDPEELCQGRPVGLAWFSPDCFEAGTLILTTQGYKAIEEVREGDMVLTHKMRWRKVTATMESERDEMVVRGYGHPGIVCSTEHPFYIKSRSEVWNNDRRNYDHTYSAPMWKKARDLTSKDYWGTPISAEELPIPAIEKANEKSVTLPVDERLLWLAGRYTGDGWTRLTETRGEVVIVCGPDEIEYLQEKLDMWKRLGARCKDGELAWHFRRVRTEGQFTCSCRGLVKWLRVNFGHLATEKTVPAWLLGAPENLKRAFIDGYVGADGHVSGKLVETSTVSKKLAFGVRTLIATMGYSPTVYIQNQQSDTIEGRKVNVNLLYKVKWREGISEDHVQTHVSDGVLWTPIRECEKTGNRKVFYNISVDEDESYIAEGLIVHNCKHFSKAKGAALVDRNIRGLAWIVLRWAGTVRPRVIILENVEEFQTWGPVRKGKPVKSKAGQTFRKWKQQLSDLGYDIEHRELVAADYGAPTTRKRFVLIARCDGQPIRWPERTHAPRDSEEVRSGKCRPWRSAAEIIDWSVPMYSIFATRQEIKERYGVNAVRPLADNTLRRIIRGVDKFTIKSGRPFLVECNHSGAGHIADIGNPIGTVTQKCTMGVCEPVMTPVTLSNTGGSVGTPVDEPIHTVRTAGGQVLSAANLIQYHTEQTEDARVNTLRAPLPTVDASNRYGLTACHMTEFYGNGQPIDITEPMRTVTSHDREALTAAHIVEFKGQDLGQHPEKPLRTITTSAGEFSVAAVRTEKYTNDVDLGYWPEVRGLLNKYCGYHLAEDEVLLLHIAGAWRYICDITMRMLTPRELYDAMGFPPDYIIDRDYTGQPYKKSQQVARCGNAVCPPMATAVVRANFPECSGNSFYTVRSLMDAMAV